MVGQILGKYCNAEVFMNPFIMQLFELFLLKCINLLTKDNVYAENEKPEVCESFGVSWKIRPFKVAAENMQISNSV